LNEDGVITASLFCMQLHQFSIHHLTDGLQEIQEVHLVHHQMKYLDSKCYLPSTLFLNIVLVFQWY